MSKLKCLKCYNIYITYVHFKYIGQQFIHKNFNVNTTVNNMGSYIVYNCIDIKVHV